ncbi:MAG: hypothetical protein QM805_07860 [Pseudomonas sp.]
MKTFARRDGYDAGKADISVTTLIDAPRVNILKQQRKDEIVVDVVDLIWPLLGTAVHHILDSADTKGNVTTEERLFAEFGGWIVSGQLDHQEEHEGLIYIADYKVTSVWSVIYGKIAWEEQLNCYAHLARKAKGAKIGGLRIVAVCRDWQRRDAETKADYPQTPVVPIDIPLWDEAKAEAYMLARVRMHQEAQMVWDTQEAVVECSDEERWTKPTTWAVVKRGNKRAHKVCATETEAKQVLVAIIASNQSAQFEIQKRPGGRTRCEKYCSVSAFCTQWAMEQVSAAAPELFGET